MATHACPVCQKPAEIQRTLNAYSPFCSRRCKTIDLGRWLGEQYRIPAVEQDESPEDLVPPRREGDRHV